MQPIDNQHLATEFLPTPEQLLFARYYIEYSGNVVKCFESMGTDRTKFYTYWSKQEGFHKWLSNFCKEQVLSRVGHWYVILEKYAAAGSFSHLERLMEIAKEFSPDKLGAVQVNVYPQKTTVFTGINEIRNGKTEDPEIYATQSEDSSRISSDASSS